MVQMKQRDFDLALRRGQQENSDDHGGRGSGGNFRHGVGMSISTLYELLVMERRRRRRGRREGRGLGCGAIRWRMKEWVAAEGMS